MSIASEALWPTERAAEALEMLARGAGFEVRELSSQRTPTDGDPELLERYLEATAASMDVELEPMRVRHGEVSDVLRGAAPCLLHLDGGGILALAGADRRQAQLICPDGPLRVPLDSVRRLACDAAEAKLAPELDGLLDAASIPLARRPPARERILADRLSHHGVARAFLVRNRPGAPPLRVARSARLPGRLAMLVALHALQYLLGIFGWALIGRGALEGRFDRGWVEAWLLLLVTLIPFRLLTSWLSGTLAVDAGALLKQRLLAGALALDPDALRRKGVGQLLGTVIESSAIEQTAVGGAFGGLLALTELVGAAVVLALGAGGVGHAVLLVVWTGVALALAWRYARRRRAWTDSRLRLTHDLVERMVGHRTRLAQEDAARWHDEEDRSLAHYVDDVRALDRTQALLLGLLPRGWLVLGVLGLVPAFLRSGTPASAALAIALGGVLLAERAFRRLAGSLSMLVGAAVAWREARPLFDAAANSEPPGSPSLAAVRTPVDDRRPVLEASDLSFRYRDRAEPILRGVTLTLRAGDRVLLSGESGGGKSTLASLLLGLRAPSSGLLLAGGLDRPTLGSNGWRRRVTAAPQFHENHLLSGTLAFNLLLGRRWPPEPADLAEAEAICRELGLGPLLDRMPAGMSQMIGETGWQLSHGERSRLFIARALLQNADLVVLDESFGALDPETLERALVCVVRRARSLLVIAHP